MALGTNQDSFLCQEWGAEAEDRGQALPMALGRPNPSGWLVSLVRGRS